MDKKQLYWLSGLLEGEGAFISQKIDKYPLSISLQMTDEDVVKKAADLLGAKVFSSHPEKAIKKGWKRTYSCKISGARIIPLLKKLYPLMGQRRKNQINKMITTCLSKPKTFTTDKEIKKILSLREKGLSYRQIAKQTRFSHQRVHQIDQMAKRQRS